MKRVSSGTNNVFADLEHQNALKLVTKAELTRQIYLNIKKAGLTQVEAGKLLGIKQPDVSKLMRGRYTGYSTDRLFSFLIALGKDINIVIKSKAKSRKEGQINVLAA